MPIQGDNFNPAIPNVDGQTPTLSVNVQRAIEAALKDLHTWLPAIVVLVRPTGTVDLQPLLLKKFGVLPAPIPLPIIQNCLVQSPRGSTYGVKLPVAVGDTGVALFCERSIDVWQVSGGAVDPLDARHHSLSDAIFVPGLYPLSQPFPPTTGADPTELVIYNGLAQLQMQIAGGFRLTNGISEVMMLLLQTLTLLASTVTSLSTASVGTLPAIAAANATVLSQLAPIIVQFTTLVGVPE